MADNNRDRDVRNAWANAKPSDPEQIKSYPEGPMRYGKPAEHTLTPSDHFRTASDGTPLGSPNHYLGGKDLIEHPLEGFDPRARAADDSSYYIKDKQKHFTRDWNDKDPNNNSHTHPVQYDGDPVFSGSTTDVNPLQDPVTQEIIDNGLEKYETDRVTKEMGDENYRPPLSPLHPFTRMGDIKHRNDPQLSNLTTFNRFHIPVSDIEHRKAFRQAFFTRPECYLMCAENGKQKLCQQAEYDEDFNASYSRMPHITRLLSPVYVAGTFGRSNLSGDNFNYLLSNRCTGVSVTGSTLSTSETITKSIQGYTVTPGMHYEGRQGSTISITFRDTKYLEVYEYIRMWMLYIWKVKYGSLAPSFNGYKYLNGFPTGVGLEGVLAPRFSHPYDRALDYTCSFFDYVLDESGTFVKYWCKYYGMYPIDLQTEALSNTNNGALVNEMSVTVTFKYQYKLENVMKSLIEFNYNAGLCDNLGQPTSEGSQVLFSQSFLQKEEKADAVMPYYIGAAGAFTATPYVVLMATNKDLFGMTGGKTVIPCLRFAPITKDAELDKRINMGITNVGKNEAMVARSELSETKIAAAQIAKEVEETKQASDSDDSWVEKTDHLIDKWIELNTDEEHAGKIDQFLHLW